LDFHASWGDAEGSGELGGAFEDDESALFNARPPSGGGSGGAGGENDDVGDAVGTGGHADGLEDSGPRAGVVTGDMEMERRFGGAGRKRYK